MVVHWLNNLSTRKLDFVLVFLLGVITGFAFPPYAGLVMALPAFSVFMLLLVNRPRRAAGYGFLYGLGQFLFAYSWLIPSMSEHAAIPLVTAWVIFVVICAEVALYPALFAWLLVKYRCPQGIRLALLAATIWVLSEWLRANMFPFAWNLIGYSFHPLPSVLQLADLGGVYLLSGLFVFLASLVSNMLLDAGRIQRKQAMIVFLATSVLVLGYGELQTQQAHADNTATLSIAVVQPNIAQNEKWDQAKAAANFDRYLQLSESLPAPVNYIVWPESALPFFIQDQPQQLQRLQQLARAKQATLIVGAETYDASQAGQPVKFFNSMIFIDGEQGIVQKYDKFHLVPFGEYIPLRAYLPAAINQLKLTVGETDITPGAGPINQVWHSLRFAPLICYESIFPRHARQLAADGADLFINISNDAWFGEAAKPQHLLMSMLRAIENRRPMVRVSNTGITAVFSASGTTLAMIPSNQANSLVTRVRVNRQTSVYTAYGNVFLWGCLLFMLVMIQPAALKRLFIWR